MQTYKIYLFKKSVMVAFKINALYFVLAIFTPFIPPFLVWLYAVFVVAAYALIVQQ